jgi:hypothetical protein
VVIYNYVLCGCNIINTLGNTSDCSNVEPNFDNHGVVAGVVGSIASASVCGAIYLPDDDDAII